MTPEAELLDIIEDYRKKIDRLTIWRTGPDRLQSLLRIAVRPRAEMARHNRDSTDFPWESLVEIMIEWHYKYPIGSAQCNEDDAFEALMLAMSFMRLDPLRAAVRVGGYRVRRNSGAFRVTHKWDMGAEVADMMLERQARKTVHHNTTQAELDWAKTQTRNRLNSFSPPINLLRSASVRANLLVDQIKNGHPEGYLPDDFSLGAGLTVGIMTKVITGLMAIADLGELAHSRVAHPGTTLLHAQRSMFIGWIRQLHSDLSEEIVGAAIDRLMVGPKRSLSTATAFQVRGCPRRR
ncbi:hypothetical protein [Nocardia sp. NPDC049526]|uniref:hypothetical protein n=1 Tax=Nocardia sp. NPDC049526 TaxID=3364316 RepID=UPI0037A15181